MLSAWKHSSSPNRSLLSSKRNIQILDTLKPTEGVSDPPGLGEDVMKGIGFSLTSVDPLYNPLWEAL
jgi:hypothetical protein